MPCEAVAAVCERLHSVRANAEPVDIFWRQLDGHNLAIVANLPVPHHWCRESEVEHAPRACYECMCPSHRLFCESLWSQALHTDGEFANGRALAYVQDAIQRHFISNPNQFPWQRLLVLSRSRDPDLKLLVVHALTGMIRSHKDGCAIVGANLTSDIVSLLKAFPQSTARATFDLIKLICSVNDAFLHLISNEVVQEVIFAATDGDPLARELVFHFRSLVRNPTMRALMDSHIKCPPNLSVLPVRFKMLATTALVLLADTKVRLKAQMDPALLHSGFAELLESSLEINRIDAGLWVEDEIHSSHLYNNQLGLSSTSCT